MKKIIWLGVVLMILSFIFWIVGSFLLIFESFLMIIIAPIAFTIGFLIILITVVQERLKEMKKEKGKYKQYEEEEK